MIPGVVSTRLEAVVTLRVRGPDGTEADVDAVIDSGSNAALSLPTELIATLRLPRFSSGGAVLADGSTRRFDVHTAEAFWDGRWRPLLVSGIGDEVLIGTRLLAGHTLRIDVVPGGAVEITRLP